MSGVFSEKLSILSSINLFTSDGISGIFTSAMLSFVASNTFAKDLAFMLSVGAGCDESAALWDSVSLWVGSAEWVDTSGALGGDGITPIGFASAAIFKSNWLGEACGGR